MAFQQLRRIIAKDSIRPLDAAKLVMLYTLKYEKHTNNDIAGLIELLKKQNIPDNLIKGVVEVMEYGGADSRQSDLFGLDAVKITKRFFKVNTNEIVLFFIIQVRSILGSERRGEHLHAARSSYARNFGVHHQRKAKRICLSVHRKRQRDAQ